MVRIAPLTGPEIWVGPRRYRFLGAIDRVPGPVDVVYFGTDQEVWEYAVVREGELLQVIPFASVEAVVMLREMNVRLSVEERGRQQGGAPSGGGARLSGERC